MFLLIKPNGTRLWRLKYRIQGKEKLMALGKYPEVSLAQARGKREHAREKSCRPPVGKHGSHNPSLLLCGDCVFCVTMCFV